MAKIKIKTLNTFLLILLIAYVSYGIAYKRGLNQGTAETTIKLDAYYKDQIDWYDSQSQQAWHAGYDFAKAELEKDFDDQLAIAKALHEQDLEKSVKTCNEDLKEAYRLGTIQGAKISAVKCGTGK